MFKCLFVALYLIWGGPFSTLSPALTQPQFSVRDRAHTRLARPVTRLEQIATWLGASWTIQTRFENPELTRRCRGLVEATERDWNGLWTESWASVRFADPTPETRKLWDELAIAIVSDPYERNGLPYTRPWYEYLVSSQPQLQRAINRLAREHHWLPAYSSFLWWEWELNLIEGMPCTVYGTDDIRFAVRGLTPPVHWPVDPRDCEPWVRVQWAVLKRTPYPNWYSYVLVFRSIVAGPVPVPGSAPNANE